MKKLCGLIGTSYGCFWKKKRNGTTSVWVEASPEEVRAMISHCFRRLRELDEKRKKQQVNNDETMENDNDAVDNKKK